MPQYNKYISYHIIFRAFPRHDIRTTISSLFNSYLELLTSPNKQQVGEGVDTGKSRGVVELVWQVTFLPCMCVAYKNRTALKTNHTSPTPKKNKQKSGGCGQSTPLPLKCERLYDVVASTFRTFPLGFSYNPS